MPTKKTNSPLAWLAGANKPNALGYVAIDPQRWAAMVEEIKRTEAKEKAARRSPSKRNLPAYRISTLDGRFDHVRGATAAFTRALELVGAEWNHAITRADLAKFWGVTITRVTEAHARSVGI